MDYIGGVVRALWITKPFILISQMKVRVIDHLWNILPYMFIFPLICFYWIVIEDTFRAVINMKILQRKACQRNFGLNIFKTAPHFFWSLDKFIDWNNQCFMLYKNYISFLFLHPLLSLYFIIIINPKFMYFTGGNWTS
jgi:hypothetical protein